MKVSFELSVDEFDTLYYACAQAEMMFRHRSNNSVCNRGNYTEAECREEMKRYREMQKRLAEMHPDEWATD